MENFAPYLLITLGIYFSLGILFAIAFFVKGIGKVDPGAAGSGFWVRLFLFPGTVAFWPWLLSKWIKS